MRRSVTGIFFLNGVVFSSWYARLPVIQSELGLDDGELGIALLGAPLGLLVAQPLTGALVARRGSRAVVAAAPLINLAVVLPALAFDLPSLFVATLTVGAANGTLDIAMNAQGVVVERRLGRPMFSSLHAAFSFGALAGAGIAALAAAAGVSPLAHLTAVAVVGGAAAAALVPGLLRDHGVSGARRIARPSRRLAVLGVIAFCALLAEGAVFDWSGIYLATETDAVAGVAPLGLAAFSLSMATGRLAADSIAARWGADRTARGGATFAALGLGLGLALATPPTAILGFALMGLGLAAVFPLALRAAGERAAAPGPELAAVSTLGYAGFLTGPPAIGLLADAVGLRLALAPVCVLCLAAAALASRVRPRASIFVK
jgi:MFS family permease